MYGYVVKVAGLVWTVFEFVSAAAWVGLGPYKQVFFVLQGLYRKHSRQTL